MRAHTTTKKVPVYTAGELQLYLVVPESAEVVYPKAGGTPLIIERDDVSRAQGTLTDLLLEGAKKGIGKFVGVARRLHVFA